MADAPVRPLPPPDPDLQAFWEACRRHELILQRCLDCRSYIHHPRAYCVVCWSQNTEWVKAAGQGTVYSFSVVYQAGHPFFRERVPYVVAYVDLEEGVRLVTNIVDAPPERVYVGMPVEAVYEDVNEEFSVALFRPRSA